MTTYERLFDVNPLRVGLLGAGGISRVHANGWRALGASVTVHSLDGAEALAEAYGFAVAESRDALLAACDAVTVVLDGRTAHVSDHAALVAGDAAYREAVLA